MSSWTQPGPALIKEHLALVDKHFPTKQGLIDYLSNRGVELENAQ